MRPEAAQTIVLVSARQEWRAVRQYFPEIPEQTSPLGNWFSADVGQHKGVIFYHGGWGKIPAAASAQYVIDRWQPQLIVNLGTCGGFAGLVEKGTIILAERTVVYDIIEQMGDYNAAIEHFSTRLDLDWLGQETPQPVVRTLLVSGDRDLVPDQIPWLKERFGAVAGDWESGAIAYVATHNGAACLILRGVSDVASDSGSEAYGNIDYFQESANHIMMDLLQHLPEWLDCWQRRK